MTSFFDAEKSLETVFVKMSLDEMTEEEKVSYLRKKYGFTWSLSNEDQGRGCSVRRVEVFVDNKEGEFPTREEVLIMIRFYGSVTSSFLIPTQAPMGISYANGDQRFCFMISKIIFKGNYEDERVAAFMRSNHGDFTWGVTAEVHNVYVENGEQHRVLW